MNAKFERIHPLGGAKMDLAIAAMFAMGVKMVLVMSAMRAMVKKSASFEGR